VQKFVLTIPFRISEVVAGAEESVDCFLTDVCRLFLRTVKDPRKLKVFAMRRSNEYDLYPEMKSLLY
jgi:hypothetical protein